MTKILIVASTFPSSESDPVPAFVKDQIIAMKAIKPAWQFDVLAPHDQRSNTASFTSHKAYDEYRFHYLWPQKFEQLAGRGIMPALKANPLNYFAIPFLFIGEFVALLRLTLLLKPELIYAHWFTPQAVIARIVGSLTRTPFAFTTHAADVDVWRKIPLIGGAIVRSNAKKAVAITAVSRRSMAKLRYFFDDTQWDTMIKPKSTILPMGVTLPEIAERSTDTPTIRTILFIGRLAEKKGVQYLLPAFAKIHSNFSDTHLIVAGDGPMQRQLKLQAGELGLNDAVSFPGYTTGKEKEALLQSADVYVLPSIITDSGDAEGLPVSLMEGLAYGNICIATNESGADDIITSGKDGFLVTQKNVVELADTIRECLNLTMLQKTAISKSAQRTAAQFSWPYIAEQHLSFLLKGKS